MAFGATIVAAGQAKESQLQGVWQVVEVTMTGPGARTVKPQPNLVIFSGNYYSRTEIHTDQPRPMLTDSAKATADELRAAWGPFVGEAGTSELSGDNLLTMRPTVAKNPAAMAHGVFSVQSFRCDGNTLTVTTVRNQNGPSPNPSTIRLVRVQ